MPYLIGVDEAGYGPNLGPLVIVGTCWKLDRHTDPANVDLYDLLKDVVSREPTATKIPIADSKKLFAQGKALTQLSQSIAQTGVARHKKFPAWNFACEYDLESAAATELAPWYLQPFANSLPNDSSERFDNACHQQGVALVAVESVFLTAHRFNQRLDQSTNKSSVLSEASIGLLRRLLEDHCWAVADEVLVVCDKHGGRNFYLSILQHFFPDWSWKIDQESRQASSYHAHFGNSKMAVHFRSGGESFLPTALASMVAKYDRELAMNAFNEYWESKIPGIKRTAGYPVDALRFAEEIQQVQEKLGIPQEQFWRKK